MFDIQLKKLNEIIIIIEEVKYLNLISLEKIKIIKSINNNCRCIGIQYLKKR